MTRVSGQRARPEFGSVEWVVERATFDFGDALDAYDSGRDDQVAHYATRLTKWVDQIPTLATLLNLTPLVRRAKRDHTKPDRLAVLDGLAAVLHVDLAARLADDPDGRLAAREQLLVRSRILRSGSAAAKGTPDDRLVQAREHAERLRLIRL